MCPIEAVESVQPRDARRVVDLQIVLEVDDGAETQESRVDANRRVRIERVKGAELYLEPVAQFVVVVALLCERGREDAWQGQSERNSQQCLWLQMSVP